MLNNYETVFILTPVLSEEQTKEAVDKFANMITEHGGEVVNREEWGQRKLAYPIQKFTSGYYTLIEFKAEPSFIATLEVNFRRDDRVIRFLTFAQDKFALEYAEKRRSRRKDATNQPAPIAEKKEVADRDDVVVED